MAIAQLVAIGGGGFSMPPYGRHLDAFALGLCTANEPRVCFLGTAGGDSNEELDRFYAAFGSAQTPSTHIGLFRRTRGSLEQRILSADLLYIGGGNAANLLALWRLHGVDRLVRQAWQEGVVVVGASAGASCLFDASLTDSFGPPLQPLQDGLGLIAGSFCAHYGRSRRRARYRQLIGEGFAPGLGLKDGTALHYVGTKLENVVCVRDSEQETGAFRVEGSRHVMEQKLPCRWLENNGKIT